MKALTHPSYPHDPKIEKALLQNLITTGNLAFDELSGFITSPDLFYDDKNRVIFEMLLEFYHKSKTIDFLTISDSITAAHPDYYDYLSEIVTYDNGTARYDNTNLHYVQILREKYILRQIIHSVNLIQSKLNDPMTLPEEVLEIFQQTSLKLLELNVGKQELPHFSEVFNISFQKLQERISSSANHKLTGIDTGLSPLNKMTAGWQPGDLIILAARPSMGKTALALYLAKQAALSNNPVLFFSLEMASYRLADRIIIGETGIDSLSYRHGTVTPSDMESIYQVSDQLNSLPIFIDEQSNPSIDYIFASARLAVRKYGIKMIIIDYLQLMDMREQKGQTRDQAIGLVTRKLKQIAKELQLPVLLLSQLNRSVESRASKLPTLADLRESGNIEQDADMVLLLFRPAYYNLTDFRDRETKNILWILTEKYRDGDAKDIIVRHNDNLSNFSNYE